MGFLSKFLTFTFLFTSTFLAFPTELFALPNTALKPPQMSNLDTVPSNQELVHILQFQLKRDRTQEIDIGNVTEITVRAKAVDGYNAVILCTYRIDNNDKYLLKWNQEESPGLRSLYNLGRYNTGVFEQHSVWSRFNKI